MDAENEKYQRAKARVDELKGFYTHLIMYVLVNIFLMILNFMTAPDDLWFYWPMMGWGIGLVWHFMGVFVVGRAFGKTWEEKKIRELMEKE